MYDAIVSGPRAGTPGLLDSEGCLGGPMNLYLYAPPVGTRQGALGSALSFDLTLPRRTAELVILTVANGVGAEFVRLNHEKMGAAAGLTADEIRALRERRSPGLADAAERLAWETTVRLLEREGLDDTEYADAVAVLGRRGLIELTTLVGYYRLVALQAKVFGIGADDFRD
jgi:4-carboxymuconolactone decarboxylase